jgi:hypothetical protein
MAGGVRGGKKLKASFPAARRAGSDPPIYDEPDDGLRLDRQSAARCSFRAVIVMDKRDAW